MVRTNLAAELDSKPDAHGYYHVMIRIYQKGEKMARIRTEIKIGNPDKYWNKKRIGSKYIIKHEDAHTLNESIEKELTRIRKKLAVWEKEHAVINPDLPDLQLTPKQIADRLKNAVDTESYIELAEKFVEQCKEQAFRTYSAKKTALNIFTKFIGGEVSLNAVTPDLIERFQAHLKTTKSDKTGKRLAASSINQYFDAMHTVHQGVMRLKGYSKRKAAQLSPWIDVDKLPSKSAYKAKLTEEQIEGAKEKIATLETKRTKLTPYEAFSIWLLSYNLAGARLSDTLLLRYENFDTDTEGFPVQVTYHMLKTGTRVSFPLHEDAKEIISRWWKIGTKTGYLLPYLKEDKVYAGMSRDEIYAASFEIKKSLSIDTLYWNKQINDALDEIRKELGLRDKLTSHNARHSFADLARRIMQEDKTITLYDIQLMLRHGEYSTTVGYIENLDKQDTSKQVKAIYRKKKTGS